MSRKSIKRWGQKEGPHLIYTEARDLDDARDLLHRRKSNRSFRRRNPRWTTQETLLDQEFGLKPKPKQKITLPTITLPDIKWENDE
jgi:hypothetical protein